MVLDSDLQRFIGWECQEGEKRWSTDASVYFYRVFSLPFLSLCFLFLCSLILTFFSSYSPLHWVFLFMATSLPFILLDSMGFFHFVLKVSPTIFFVSCGHLFKITH